MLKIHQPMPLSTKTIEHLSDMLRRRKYALHEARELVLRIDEGYTAPEDAKARRWQLDHLEKGVAALTEVLETAGMKVD